MSDETINDLKLRMAAGIVNDEVTQYLELFESCIHLVPVSTYARIKLLTINITKEIYQLEQMSPEEKLKLAEHVNDYIVRMLNDLKGHMP